MKKRGEEYVVSVDGRITVAGFVEATKLAEKMRVQGFKIVEVRRKVDPKRKAGGKRNYLKR